MAAELTALDKNKGEEREAADNTRMDEESTHCSCALEASFSRFTAGQADFVLSESLGNKQIGLCGSKRKHQEITAVYVH